MRRVLLLPFLLAACTREPPPSTGLSPSEVSLASVMALSADGGTSDAGPCGDYSALKNAYFGDLHAHTSFSLDAWISGTRNNPYLAYAFARGATLQHADGTPQRLPLGRELDFSVVSDHSEFLDVIGMCTIPGEDGGLSQDPYCEHIRQVGTDEGGRNVFPLLCGILTDCTDGGTRPPPLLPPQEAELCQRHPEACAAARLNVWQRAQVHSALLNAPCTFSSLNAYEWSEATNNMHRVVVFANEKVPEVPVDYIHYPTANGMLERLSTQCTEDAGCDFITIPHNSNLSDGRMFVVPPDSSGEDLERRARHERLVEIFQIKGQSECLNTGTLGDPEDDAWCNFETVVLNPDIPRAELRKGYVRKGLEEGLRWYQRTGKNPLEMGIIAATDTHNGTPGDVQESTPRGHSSFHDNTPDKRLGDDDPDPAFTPKLYKGSRPFNPGGLTGVWARQNTREEIFGALERREVWGTSGPRIVARFAQLWEPGTLRCGNPLLTSALVHQGTSMGSRMTPRADGTKPTFFIQALADQTPLVELQILKATLAADGTVQRRTIHFPAPTEAGLMAWCQQWVDAEYDPDAPAFYYVRLLEKHTWRWSHYDCQSNPARYGGWCDALNLDRTIQERAWTSPIFHLP